MSHEVLKNPVAAVKIKLAAQPTADSGGLADHGSLRTYVIGFVLSLLLTAEAYQMVVSHTFSPSKLIIIVLVLAVVQLVVQLFFFLHLDRMARSPWNIIILLFMGIVVSILVFGSLWIMQNLNYHMQTPAQINQYMQKNADL
jgi:cytochrome o ubiquinol oxidase operon protein cyoD